MRSIILVVMALGCSSGGVQGQVVIDTGTYSDTVGPSIVHTPMTSPQTYQMPVSFDAVVTDESGVLYVELMFKQETSAQWNSVLMSEVGGGLYQGTIGGDEIYDASVSYYFVARDSGDNDSCLPADCSLVPWSFPVVN